jgi:hypothetical protein
MFFCGFIRQIEFFATEPEKLPIAKINKLLVPNGKIVITELIPDAGKMIFNTYKPQLLNSRNCEYIENKNDTLIS